MRYNYQTERPHIFTEDGQVMFLKIRDEAMRLTRESGAVMMEKLMVRSGSSWTMLACVDRLVELGDLVEVPQQSCAGQHRIFRRPFR